MPRIQAALVGLVSAFMMTLPVQSQEPNASVRAVAALVGTVESIDWSSRALALRVVDGPYYTVHTIYIGPELTLFNELRTGDKVAVRLYDSVIVSVRPGVKPSVPVDTTAGARTSDPSGKSEVLRQMKAAVRVESIDRKTNMVVYMTADNRRVIRGVLDPRLLSGVAPGDVIEITYSRERALDLQRVQ